MRLSNMMRGMFGVDPLTKEGDDEYYKASRTFSNAARAYLGFDPLDSRYSVMDEEGLKQNQKEEQAYKSADLAGIVHDVLPPKAALTGALGIAAGAKALFAPSYKEARQMLLEGRGYKDILKQTGIHARKGSPAFWEIDDYPAKIKMTDFGVDQTKRFNETTVGDLLDHEELYKNYPELKKYKVVLEASDDEAWNGWFDPTTNTIGIRIAPDYKKAYNKPERLEQYLQHGVKHTLIHELDHAVAKIENFPAGGDPKNMVVGEKAALRRDKAKKEYASMTKQYNKLIEELHTPGLDRDTRTLLEDSREEFEKEMRKVYAELRHWNWLTKYKDTSGGKTLAYRDLYGERMARAAADRSGFNKKDKEDMDLGISDPEDGWIGSYEFLDEYLYEPYRSPKKRDSIKRDWQGNPLDPVFDYEDPFPPTIK